MDKVEVKVLEVKFKLIICGVLAYSCDWDYVCFWAIVDKVGVLLLVDIVYLAGLIVIGLFNNFMFYCYIVIFIIYKILCGLCGGIIMMGENFDNFWGCKMKKGNLIKMLVIFNSGVFFGMQGGLFEYIIVVKVVVFGEVLQFGFKMYMEQVVKNVQAMAWVFVEKGYKLIFGGIDNYLMLIDLCFKGVIGKVVEQKLGVVDIIVNKNMVFFDI